MPFTHSRRLFAIGTAAALLTGVNVVASAGPSSGSTSYSAGQASGMRFGFTTPTSGSMTTGQAVDRQIARYGPGIIRRYYNRFPASWSTLNQQGHGLPVNVSFKMTPQSVLAGKYDASLTAWFKAAPTDRTTWWSYMPEPEDDIAAGQYTAAQFRAAYSRVAGLERRASNPRLVSTLTLMAYTAGSCGKGSTRNILDYWPGATNVDLIAYDCSNWGWKVGQYTEPSVMLKGARTAAAKLGKPWGLGEFESRLLSGDTGTRRAAWLKAVASYVVNNGGRFACYFDEKRSVDFRLNDTKSQASWASVVSHQTP